MELLEKLNVKMHRMIGKVQSSIMTFGINRGYWVSALMGLVTIAKIVYEINVDGLDGLWERLDTIIPLIATIGTTGLTSIYAVASYKNLSHGYYVISSDEHKDNVLHQVKLDKRYINSEYRVDFFHNGKEHEMFIMSDQINTKLFEDNFNKDQPLKINPLNYKFEVVEDIKEFIPVILKRTFESDRLIFNGKLVRMCNDLYLDTEHVDIQQVRYFEGQCTNEIVFKRIKSNNSLNDIFVGSKLLMGDNHDLYDLAHSHCANYIGASTLAITKDNYLIIGKQGDFSRANSGRFAPSGSGSVNYKDVKQASHLNDLLIKTMEREFKEENNCGHLHCSRMQTLVLGYCRLLERGGKPDFFGITFLDEDHHYFKQSTRLVEKGIQEASVFIKLEDGQSMSACLMKFCNEHVNERKISIQLHILTRLLSNFEPEIVSERQDFYKRTS